MSDEVQHIKGAKNVVLEDCDNVMVIRGDYVQAMNVKHLAAMGCLNAQSHHTYWDIFTDNTVAAEACTGNIFKGDPRTTP